MKKFFQLIAIFTCVLVGPFYLIQFCFDSIGKRCAYETKGTAHINRILNENIDADIVIFGNSRAQAHYDTQVMDSILNLNCYNLGWWGCRFDFQYQYIIKPYLKRNKKPSLIIQEVGPHVFFTKQIETHSYRKEFLPFLDLPEFDNYIKESNEITILDRYLPIKYRGVGIKYIMEIFGDTIRKEKDMYWPRPKEGAFVNNFEYENLDSIKPLEHDEYCLSLFSEYLKFCEDQNIHVILVISPMHVEKFYNYCQMDEFFAMMDSLRKPTNTPLLDYSHLFGNDTVLFKESTHLSDIGAATFSKTIAIDLQDKQILIRGE